MPHYDTIQVVAAFREDERTRFRKSQFDRWCEVARVHQLAEPRLEGAVVPVTLGLLARLEAKAGRGEDLAAFLRGGREIVEREDGTVTWYAYKIDETTYGIFDTFESEAARQAHLNGEIPQALGQVADDLLASAPDIRPIEILAVK